MAQPKPFHGLSNFIQLNPSVFISPQPAEPSLAVTAATKTTTKPPPDVILLTAWLNAQPRHISKYIASYAKLYPSARIIVVTTDTLNVLFHSVAVNLNRVSPVLDILCGLPPEARILVHSFSNGGASSLCLIAGAYLEKTGKHLPATALVLDSSPGRGRYAATVRAFAVSLPKNVLVRIPAELFFRIFFGFYSLYLWASGGLDMVSVLRKQLNEKERFDVRTPRLYVYGCEDVMVDWKDVEEHVADAKGKGYVVEGVRFEDTGHVSHLVKHEEEYLEALQRLWDSAVV